jgi:MoaA/NifB/PqqE/SkfB family radical SAM enzyme
MTEADVLLRDWPRGVMVELTNRCQLKCVTCPREYLPARESVPFGDMPFENFVSLVKNGLHRCATLGLTGGGETLLYPRIVEAVECALEHNPQLQIFVSTNAYVGNTAAIVSRLAGKIRTLQISVDGTGAVFEAIRKPARFDIFRRNVAAACEILKGTSTNVSFNLVLIRENVGNLGEVLAMAHELDVPQVTVTPINLVFHEWPTSYYELFRTEEVRQAVAGARRQAAEYGIAFEYFDITASPGFRACPYPWDNFYISWDGRMPPCCAKPSPSILSFGKPLDLGLMGCVNSANAVEFRRLSLRNEAPAFCAGCHFLCGPRS